MSLDDGCVLCWGHLHDLGMRLCSVFLGWCNDVRHVRATDVFGAFARCIWLRMYSMLSVGGLEYYIPVALCVLSVNLYHYHNLKVSCSIFVVYGCKFYQQRTRN